MVVSTSYSNLILTLETLLHTLTKPKLLQSIDKEETEISDLKIKEKTGSSSSDMKMMDTLPTLEVNASMSMEEETDKMNLLLFGEDTTTTTRSGISGTQMKFRKETAFNQTNHSDFFQRCVQDVLSPEVATS